MKKTIKIVKDQETEFGVLKVGQEITIDSTKAKLLINRGIGNDVLQNRSTPKTTKAKS